jgi:cytochrome c
MRTAVPHPRPGPAARAWLLPAALALVAGACQEKRFDPPAHAGRVADAEREYDAAAFDTIGWDSPGQRHFEGNNAYAAHCRRCHGPIGEGDTDYARERGLPPLPSLIRPDWPEGDSTALLRRRIFTGHPAGMPVWGVGGGVTLREIDAIAAYIAEQLRPEFLRPAGR